MLIFVRGARRVGRSALARRLGTALQLPVHDDYQGPLDVTLPGVYVLLDERPPRSAGNLDVHLVEPHAAPAPGTEVTAANVWAGIETPSAETAYRWVLGEMGARRSTL